MEKDNFVLRPLNEYLRVYIEQFLSLIWLQGTEYLKVTDARRFATLTKGKFVKYVVYD